MLQSRGRAVMLLSAVLVTDLHLVWGDRTYDGVETHRSALAHGKVSPCLIGNVVTQNCASLNADKFVKGRKAHNCTGRTF